MKHFTVKQLREHLEDSSEQLFLLDVREQWEFEKCSIAGSILIPMSNIHNNLNKIDKSKKIVVICHHGVRSFQIAYFLEKNGFTNVINLTGGVDSWAREIDPNMTLY